MTQEEFANHEDDGVCLPATEYLSDPSDQATALEMATTDAEIRRRQKLTEQQQKPLPDGSYAILDCDECGDEIGAERLRAAAQNLFCIYCATRKERRR